MDHSPWMQPPFPEDTSTEEDHHGHSTAVAQMAIRDHVGVASAAHGQYTPNFEIHSQHAAFDRFKCSETSPTEHDSPSPIRLKFFYLDRVKICLANKEVKFSELMSRVATAFPETSLAVDEGSESLEIAYQDKGGNKVRIDGDDSLRLAILEFGKESLLKFQIHVKTKESGTPTVACRHFKEVHRKYGDSGRFSHALSEADSPTESIAVATPTGACWFFKAGRCKYGNSCRFSHSLSKADSPTKSIGAATRHTAKFQTERDMEFWLMKQLAPVGSGRDFSYLRSGDGFEKLSQIISHGNVSAKIIHLTVKLLTKLGIRTRRLGGATNKIYSALLGSAFLSQLHTHIPSNLEQGSENLEPYIAFSKELVECSCDGWKELPLDELKTVVDNLQTEDAATRKLRYDIAMLLEQREELERLDAVQDDQSDTLLEPRKQYTMVESSAAKFEDDEHVLQILQGSQMGDLCFLDDFASLEHHIQEPIYLKHREDQDVYDFRSVFSDMERELPSSKLHILQDWPEWATSLDKSQIAALKHGLTKRLALIQGPPGTGKTFVGLLIVKILMANLKGCALAHTDKEHASLCREKISQGNAVGGPIFIVCHTNHALDRFLKGIYGVEKNVIQIGGQPTTEFNLIALAADQQIDRQRKRVLNFITRLAGNWRSRLKGRNFAPQEFEVLSAKYKAACKRRSELVHEIGLSLLRTAKVIGMTPTAAARHHTLLKSLQPTIIIIQAAAQVLESQVLTCLSSSTQHLILIGDSLQPRPSVAVHRLALEHDLNVSLFERLIRSGVEYVTLEEQRRMSPSISRVISSLYPMLRDHASVLAHENVKGIKPRVLFWDHKAPEELECKEETARRNVEEARLAVELCFYLLQQGYELTDVKILSMYKGQIQEIRRRLIQKLTINWNLMSLSASKVASRIVRIVDDYDGEESKIVILSMVRSNDYLGEHGCSTISLLDGAIVALSRPRNGLFILGNGDFLFEKTDLWRKLLQEMKSSGSYGTELTLCCQNHPQTEARVVKADDFKAAANGGCRGACEFQLDCGHACPRQCHPLADHERSYLSMESALRCTQPCRRRLACGHQCRNRCGRTCTSLCVEMVSTELPCGHSVDIACCENTAEYICEEPCGDFLISWGCKHTCMGACGLCKQGEAHISCQEKCGRNLPCGHSCESACCRVCPPCSRPCLSSCLHSDCAHKCGDLCIPCFEPCLWSCEHHRCDMQCYEICARPRCDEPCEKLLECQHPCVGLCGEVCPSVCRICNPDFREVISPMPKTELDALRTEFVASDRFVQLLDCGHIFEVEGLDAWMDTEQSEPGVYELKMKQCPQCGAPIFKSLRYGNIVKEKLLQIEEVKRRMKGFEKTNEGNMWLRDQSYADAKKNFAAAIQLNPAILEAYYGLGCALCGQKKFREAIGCFVFVVKHSSFAKAVVGEAADHLLSTSSLPPRTSRSWADNSLAIKSLLQWACALSMVEEFFQAMEVCGIVVQAEPNHISASEIRERLRKQEEVRPSLEEARKGSEVGSKGRWHKCPNGHLFTVRGECWGQMQIPACPECM